LLLIVSRQQADDLLWLLQLLITASSLNLQILLKNPSRCAFFIISPRSSRMARMNWKSHMEASVARHSTAQHSTAQHSTAQHSTAQHSTAQHSTAQHSTAQHLMKAFKI
jgi:hypothetical protein